MGEGAAWATIARFSRAALTGQVRATIHTTRATRDIYRPVIGTYDRSCSQRSNAADDVDVLRLNLAFAEVARLVKLAEQRSVYRG